MRAMDRHGRPLELTVIIQDCKGGPCPRVSRSARGTAGVQGYVLHVPDAPSGKTLVELPIEMLLRAGRALG